MPKIASKYKRGDVGADISKFKARDDTGFVTKVEGDLWYGGNEVYLYP